MKKLFTFLFLFSVFYAFSMPKLYVSRNGSFVKSSYSLQGKSLNNIMSYLGYKKGTFYTWDAKYNDITICFKILCKEIVCIISNEDLGTNISDEKVTRILNDNGFAYEDAYNTYQLESDLENGIKGHYLTASFVEDVTGNQLRNGEIEDELNGYIYSFKNGVMISYKSSDGYNKWAKEYKDREWFLYVKENAERFFSNKDDIIAEINMQCDYYASIDIEQLYKGSNSRYNYNFALLYIDLYCPKIKIDEFNKIVHNGAKDLRNSTSYSPVMEYKGKKYYFDYNDLLMRIE